MAFLITNKATIENRAIEAMGIQTKRHEMTPVKTIEAKQINGAGIII